MAAEPVLQQGLQHILLKNYSWFVISASDSNYSCWGSLERELQKGFSTFILSTHLTIN